MSDFSFLFKYKHSLSAFKIVEKERKKNTVKVDISDELEKRKVTTVVKVVLFVNLWASACISRTLAN